MAVKIFFLETNIQSAKFGDVRVAVASVMVKLEFKIFLRGEGARE